MKRRSIARGPIAACALLALGLIACGTGGGSATGSGATSQIPDSEFEQAPISGENTARASSDALETVYFDYDRYNIRSDATSVLRKNADAIKGSGWSKVTIEGHCDERGSEEYNLALGERRANSVKQYLVDLGVSSSKLSTVSFGEARPAVPGHDESAYRYNRRSAFTVR